MSYQGDYTPAKSVVFNFNTAAFSDGSPITLAGTPALSVYKNSTTESTSGVTLTVDYDSRTGMHHVVIDTSADGTFYAAGNDFDVIITAGTVGGTSVVGRKVGSFSLSNRSALRPATADRTLVVDAAGLADANVVKIGPTGSGTAQTARDLGASVLLSSGTGTGQLKLASGYVAMTWADIAAPTTSVNLSGTTVNLVNTLTTYTGNTVQTGDSFARIGATGSGLTSLAPSSTALSTATWTNTLATNLGTLAGHDPGATLGTSTLTQTQVTGGAYALNSASFGFNAALDFTTAQKAATLARVTLADTLTTYTGNTVQTGDSFGRIGATGSGLTSLAPSATALSTAQWTNTLATNLGTLASHDPGTTIGTSTYAGGPVASVTAGVTVTTNNDKTGYTLTVTPPTANENADALLDRTDAIETGLTPRQAWRLGAAADGGVVAGAATTDVTIKGAGVATQRVEATVDSSGNRSVVILTL